MNTPRNMPAPAKLAIALASILAAGCSVLGKPAPDASRHFVLTSTDAADAAPPARGLPDLHFGLGPVKLPGYLETQALVSTGRGGSVQYVPNAYWAEPLAPGLARALLYRTETRIGTAHGVAYPWYSTTRIDWKVPVDVLRFEATEDGQAVLVARWSVQRGSDSAAMAGGETSCEESPGTDAARIVAALSACVDRLAGDIAAGVARASGATAATAAKPVR